MRLCLFDLPYFLYPERLISDSLTATCVYLTLDLYSLGEKFKFLSIERWVFKVKFYRRQYLASSFITQDFIVIFSNLLSISVVYLVPEFLICICGRLIPVPRPIFFTIFVLTYRYPSIYKLLYKGSLSLVISVFAFVAFSVCILNLKSTILLIVEVVALVNFFSLV